MSTETKERFADPKRQTPGPDPSRDWVDDFNLNQRS